MLPSLHSVTSSGARFRIMQDRGDVWPVTSTPDSLLPDFGSLAEGLLPGRQIATDKGWRPVETLKAGDMVLTFDHGMRRLDAITACPVGHDPRRGKAPFAMHVPKGAIGNRRAISLLPSQLVLLDCSFAEARFGNPFVLVPAGYLEGYRGICAERLAPGTICHMLAFATEEIVHADGSALLSCHATERGARKAAHRTYPRVTPPPAKAFRDWVRNEQQVKGFTDEAAPCAAAGHVTLSAMPPRAMLN